MSVISIELDMDTEVYPYTEVWDLNECINDLVHERVDASLIYTRDIVDTWTEYGMPECEEFEHPGTISEAITLATYEALVGKDYSDQVLNGQIEYAGHLLGQLDTISPLHWSSSTEAPMREAREALEAIATGEVDTEEAHPVLLEWRDTINAAV